MEQSLTNRKNSILGYGMVYYDKVAGLLSSIYSAQLTVLNRLF